MSNSIAYSSIKYKLLVGTVAWRRKFMREGYEWEEFITTKEAIYDRDEIIIGAAHIYVRLYNLKSAQPWAEIRVLKEDIEICLPA
jgi:hypothetical protein